MSDMTIDHLAQARLHPRRRRPALTFAAALLFVGALAVVFPRPTALAVGAAGGWLLWFVGAAMLGFSLLTFTGRARLIGATAALCAVGAGGWITFHPTTGALATAILLASALLADGAGQLAIALHLRPLAAWRWMVASATASLAAAGMLAARAAGLGPEVISWSLALASISSGMALLAVGLTRREPS